MSSTLSKPERLQHDPRMRDLIERAKGNGHRKPAAEYHCQVADLAAQARREGRIRLAEALGDAALEAYREEEAEAEASWSEWFDLLETLAAQARTDAQRYERIGDIGEAMRRHAVANVLGQAADSVRGWSE